MFRNYKEEQRDIISVSALAGTVPAARPQAAASCDKGRQMSKKMPQQDATAMNEFTGL